MNEALLLAAAFKSYNLINFIHMLSYLYILQSLLRGHTFFYTAIDGTELFTSKKEESSYKYVHRLI